ncbi:carbon-nitrogen hydrolase family protein [Rhodococcus sp. NPDC059968]|uniref:carbon-nitrogen hydrolase family protein n=1 Tax=Rhodococcus sp. NPDC059968 TaxID=3347017 RepID=UPI00366D6A4D
MTGITAAAVQLPACTDDRAANIAAIESALTEAASAGADLVVLPELVTTPYFGGESAGAYREWAEPVPGPLTTRVAALAAELDLDVVLPLFEHDRAAGTFHNSAVVLSGGRLVPTVDRTGREHETARKLHLPIGDEPAPGFDESAHFVAGEWLGTQQLDEVRIGTLICYDRRFPECWRELRALGAGVVAVPVAGSGGDSIEFFLGELRTHAKENGLFAVVANKVGTEWVGGHPVDNYGSSCIVGPDGELLAHRPRSQGPGLAVAVLDLDELAETRRRLRYFDHRRTDLFPGPSPVSLMGTL